MPWQEPQDNRAASRATGVIVAPLPYLSCPCLSSKLEPYNNALVTGRSAKDERSSLRGLDGQIAPAMVSAWPVVLSTGREEMLGQGSSPHLPSSEKHLRP